MILLHIEGTFVFEITNRIGGLEIMGSCRSVHCVGTFWVGVDELWILIDAVSRSGLRSVKGVGSCKPIVVPGFNGDV